MPIPMPPPPPPYVAPDLRPIVARSTARLTFVRDANGRLRGATLDHGLWIAAEDAPLEVRFHRRVDGSVWAEQATYEAGDRLDGAARASASAHVQVLSRRAVGGMGAIRGLVRYTVRDGAGRALRTWTSDQCGAAGGAVRLDRPGSPAEPTYPSTWEGCGGFAGAYVLGRMVALDRGWAMRAPSEVRGVAALTSGTYRLDVDVDPIDALADGNRGNDTATLRLVVTTSRQREGDGEGDGFDPFDPNGPVGVSPMPADAPVARTEPAWVGHGIRRLERRAAARSARRTGRADGAGPHAAPPAAVDLPDLRSAPSYGVATRSMTLRARGRRDMLQFGALTWNAGPGPLEVEAFRESGDTLQAYQVFYRDGARAARQPRGTLIWHAAPGHDHFHFHAFARYQLTAMDGTVLRDGGKHSWCIVDTDMVDTTRPGARSTGDAFGGGIGTTGGCGSDPGSLWARMALSVGAGDYYGPGIAGQSFDITTLPNGFYRIRIEANPSGVIAEADHGNNVSTRIVRITGPRGARRVTARPVPTVDDSGGVAPCHEGC